MIPWAFLTFPGKIPDLGFGPIVGPQNLEHFLDFWPSGGPYGPQEYFIDIRAENPVQGKPEIVDLELYGPPW